MSKTLEELLEDLYVNSESDNAGAANNTEQNEAPILAALYALLLEENQLSVGDFVEWKPGLANKDLPYKKSLLVTKVIEEPVADKNTSAGGPYFGEMLDIVCAGLTDNGFYEYHYDSRRLQHYQTTRGQKS